MALSTNKVNAPTAGVAAAASSRVGNGGRNVASVGLNRVEDLAFAPNIGVNEESILHYRDDPDLGGGGGGRGRRDGGSSQFSGLIMRNASAFRVEELDETAQAGDAHLFLADVLRGIGTYEMNLRATSPSSVRPGSVLNFMY